MSEYDEDLKKACEILNNTKLDESVKIAVEAMDDAAIDIGMEANQEWHAKITLESALMHIAEKVAKRPSLTIPKSIAEMVDKQKTTQLKFDDYDNEFFPYFKWSTEFDKQHGKFSSSYLLDAYLAGKALGVDLVKVVADD